MPKGQELEQDKMSGIWLEDNTRASNEAIRTRQTSKEKKRKGMKSSVKLRG